MAVAKASIPVGLVPEAAFSLCIAIFTHSRGVMMQASVPPARPPAAMLCAKGAFSPFRLQSSDT